MRNTVTTCQCCGQTIKARKPLETVSANTADMTETQLYAFYKKTSAIEDVRFWIARGRSMSTELLQRFVALGDCGDMKRMKRELPALQACWRMERNEAERQAHLEAGDQLINGFWTVADESEAA